MSDKIEVFDKERSFNYDTKIKDLIPEYENILTKIEAFLISNYSKECELKILCIGCGTGTEIVRIAKISSKWKVYGCDPSIDMLNAAEEKIKLNNLNNVKLKHGTIEVFNKDKFDVINISLVLHFFNSKDKYKLLKKISQVLKLDGNLIISDIYLANNFEQKLNDLRLDISKQNFLDTNSLNNYINHIRDDIKYISDKEISEMLNTLNFVKIIRTIDKYVFGQWVSTFKGIKNIANNS